MMGRVVIVDDEAPTRRIARRWLERAGFDVQEAQSCAEAQAALDAQAFDAAVVDLIMPGDNGLVLLSWMRTHAPTVVPVVLSGAQDADMAIEAVRHGAFDHFRSRPLPLPESMQTVAAGKTPRAATAQLLLRAHEALVQADPSNADRFAAVLQVLQMQAKPAPPGGLTHKMRKRTAL